MRFSSRVDRILAGWVVGMLCALVLALTALALINRIVYNPAGQVSQYFAAVRDGNGERALGILGAEVPESNGAMLDGAPLRASMANLKNLEVAKTEIADDGQSALVTVSYTLSGEPKTTDFHLTKVGSHWGVFDRWHIDSRPLPLVQVTADQVSAATLNNEKVAVKGGNENFAVTYPGEFIANYESALYQSDPHTAQVTEADAQRQTLGIKLIPGEAAQKSIDYQIKNQLDTCAAKSSLYPAGCPFEYPFTGRVQGDVTWTIEKYPHPTAQLGADGSWTLPVSTGQAKISFTQLDLFTGQLSEHTDTVTFDYLGTLETTDQEVVVKPVAG